MKMLSQRGPDLQGQHTVTFPNVAQLDFRGHVLWQQGDVPCAQPIVRDEHVMLLNGDIYNKPISIPLISDTQWLFEQLSMFEKPLVSYFLNNEINAHIHINVSRTTTCS